MDTARDGVGRLVKHANRQCAVAISWSAAAGPGIRDCGDFSKPIKASEKSSLGDTHYIYFVYFFLGRKLALPPRGTRTSMLGK